LRRGFLRDAGQSSPPRPASWPLAP
jgi:hypothetical protein